MKGFAASAVFLASALLAFLLGGLLPDRVGAFFYSISLIIKECMIFALPLVIFSLIFTSICRIGVGSVKSLAIAIPLIVGSNFINTLIAYFLGASCVSAGLISSIDTISASSAASFAPLFCFFLPKIISNDIALISAVVCGVAYAVIARRDLGTKLGASVRKAHEHLSCFLNTFIKYFFKVLVPLMPLFIFGTVVKLSRDGIISQILSEYLAVMLIFLISAYGYVFAQLFALSTGSLKIYSNYLKNILPAAITGFGSMSSAAALPLSIKAAEENSIDRDNARIIAPCSVNIHLIGDCFFIPFIALVMLISFGKDLPNFATYLIFAAHFVAAKFAVAAVPGGGILVMLPVLQKYLEFNADMLGLITGLYVLFDPFITGCNVAGNGSLAIAFDKLMRLRK
ncbi:MAG: dicarboxylate/amino acid:cation symporter [Holosporales bacterium]|jgi:Na+/H+-dicarboxylate symporter|nr:dicarboxylate/amino acid:cation symporter [Holosporales bacterium]